MQTKVSKWKLDTGTMHIFFLCQGSVAPYNSVQCLAPTALPKTQSFGHRCFQFFSPGWAPVSPLQRLLGTFALCRSASDQWHARSRKSHHADLGTEGCGNLGFCGGWRGLLPRLPGAWDIFPSLSFYHISYSFHTCQAHAIHAIQAITCHYMPLHAINEQHQCRSSSILHGYFMGFHWVLSWISVKDRYAQYVKYVCISWIFLASRAQVAELMQRISLCMEHSATWKTTIQQGFALGSGSQKCACGLSGFMLGTSSPSVACLHLCNVPDIEYIEPLSLHNLQLWVSSHFQSAALFWEVAASQCCFYRFRQAGGYQRWWVLQHHCHSRCCAGWDGMWGMDGHSLEHQCAPSFAI